MDASTCLRRPGLALRPVECTVVERPVLQPRAIPADLEQVLPAQIRHHDAVVVAVRDEQPAAFEVRGELPCVTQT